jgi:ribosomal protein S12 methylthiotransferase accessory factor
MNSTCPTSGRSTLIGLAPPKPIRFWADLRVGELKTLLALAIGDEEAIREGCEWVRHFEQIDPARRLVYRCIETLLELGGADRSSRRPGTPLRQINAGERRSHAAKSEQRCFGIEAPGLALKGCDLHRALLAAYAKSPRSNAGRRRRTGRHGHAWPASRWKPCAPASA